MRLVLAVLVSALLVLIVGGAHALEPGEARIRLTAVQLEMRTFHGVISRTYAVYNRPAYPDRLGTSTVSCTQVAREWLDCSQLIRLTRGTIIARGYVPAAAAYRVLAVVGGTGYYANVGGEMTVQPLGTGQQILINLIAF